jgi:alginate O-acetyltransferase complex protein AlgI
MLFNSFELIFLFLPLVLLVAGLASYLLPAATVPLLLAASLAFYGWWEPAYLPVLVGSVVVNYLVGTMVADRPRLLACGIAFNIVLLGYFKYSWFVLGHVLERDQSTSLLDPVLPLAISFFTFQQIAYLVDMYRGSAPRARFLDYALFVSFFPQLIAGPIVRAEQTLPQIARLWNRAFRRSDLVVGLTIFMLGLAKKTILADGIAPVASAVFDAAEAGQPVGAFEAWAGTLAYTFQIYFDFSGYCDMAIGSARMFGVRLPLNFYAPYKATSIVEFWRRWHITLSRFLRDYLYIPLGGNRSGPSRRNVNILAVMLLGGLWHGAGWTFVVWGGLHGIYIVANHFWRNASIPRVALPAGLRVMLAWFVTMLCVMVAWVAFRAETMTGALTLWSAMAGFGDGLAVVPARYADALGPAGHALAGVGVRFDADLLKPHFDIPRTLAWLAGLTFITLAMPNSADLVRRWRPAFDLPAFRDRLWIDIGRFTPIGVRFMVLTGLFVASLFAMRGYSEFLYFQF